MNRAVKRIPVYGSFLASNSSPSMPCVQSCENKNNTIRLGSEVRAINASFNVIILGIILRQLVRDQRPDPRDRDTRSQSLVSRLGPCLET